MTTSGGLIQQYGPWIYGILFAIVFCETGLVVTPFLPGDSLLFAVGALAADPNNGLNVWFVTGLMLVAAILGDTVNYCDWKAGSGEGFANSSPTGSSSRRHLAQNPRVFMRNTAERQSFWPDLFRLCAPSHRLWQDVGAMNYSKFFDVSTW